MQVEDVTLEQMLVGLYQSNRSAFIGDNMNQLKVGQIMRKPRDEELHAIDPQQALQEVRLHTANWNAYRNDVAQAVAQSQAAPAESQAQSSGGQITARTEDKAAPPPAGPRDVVKLSKSEAVGSQKTAAAGTGTGAVADDKLRALEEESTAQDKSIAEVNERIAFFEKQIQDMQQLLLVQNQILADLQKGKPVDGAQLPAPAPAPEGAQPEQKPADAPQAAQPPAPKPAPAPAEPAAAPGMLNDLLQNPMLLPAGGGILALLVGGWLLLRRQRRRNLDSFEKGILTSSGLKTDTVFGTTGGAAVDTGNTTFMSDFAHRNGDMIDTSDVDPISEAEVYMAYGRDAQAEEILKDAITKEPKRYELHLKLLEIYANRKDAAAFETLAGELYATLGTNDPTWRKVAELGRTLEADNPMYAPAGEPPATSAASGIAQGAAGAALATAAIAATAAPQEEAAPEEELQDNSLDFDLGMLAAEDTQAPVGFEKEEEAGALEPLPDLEGSALPVEADAPQASQPESSDFDLQFELPEPPAESAAQLDAAELGLPPEEPAPVEQPEETSFDLPALELETPVAESAPELPAAEAEADTLASSFDLPEMPSTEPDTETKATPEPATDEVVEEISFDLPELTSGQGTAAPAEPEKTADEAESLLASFDMDLPREPDNLEQQAEAIDLTAPAEEIAAFDLPEVPETVPAPIETPAAAAPPVDETPVEEIVFDTPVPDEPAKSEAAPLDFNFSLDVEAEETVQEETAPAASIPDLDLSGINLDMAEPSSDAFDNAEEITLAAGEESADVDTKLDLVTAYMDMGDNEGARELLEEVLQEGGPKQRDRAQKMIDALG